MESKTVYHAIGMMSGTSLDGLDIAWCRFTRREKWEFKIQSANTIPYTAAWKKKLASAHLLSGEDLLILHGEFGEFMGRCCAEFVREKKIRTLDLVASHGHTIFHQPDKRMTFQLGQGNAIHSVTGLPVVYDFRSLDVTLGGQGAPLVPVGDRHLFGEYDICLNLGGIANLSAERNRQRIAFDICFANMGLNYLAFKAGKEFDQDGHLAARGKTNKTLLAELSGMYKSMRRKRPSLSREGFEKVIQPLLEEESISLSDKMHTFCQSIADEIRLSIPAKKYKQGLLTTGGGALNPVLIELLKQSLHGEAEVSVPPREIIEFKEALVFAFLGVLRIRGEINVLQSVTHASRNTSSGTVVQ
jgi:anhydro-N-acetylmuramic acid kinase